MTIVPYLRVAGAAAAIAFYQRAFGAEEAFRLEAPGGGTVVHAELTLHGARVMLSDDMPDYQGGKSLTPVGLGGSPVGLHLQFDGTDALETAWARAVDAGCTVAFPLAEQFWGDRYGKLTDPFGHEWSLAATVRALNAEQIQAAAAAAFAAGADGCGPDSAPADSAKKV